MCQDCDTHKWLMVIEAVLDTGVSNSDETFLSGISDWVEKNDHVTEKQIASIKEKADEAGVDYE